MKYADKMSNLLADLAVMNVKLHNIHWNIVGEQFVPIHNFTQQLYEEMFEDFDAVAEAIKMAGKYPLASLKSYLEASDIKELPSNKSYDTKAALDHVLKDLKLIVKKAHDIRNVADKADDFPVVALMEGIISKNDKHIWFVSSMLK